MSSDGPPIVVEGLWKRYKLGTQSRIVRLAKRFAPWAVDHRVIGDFYALQDVSFTVDKGESLGVVGKNGAGKSTLLKLLCGVTHPTQGRFSIRGRVAPLIEVGAGFHQELSGRENIFLNASIMGMTRADTKKKFDEIVEFSGLEKFIDTPVKRYSSGMLARLGFSVSVHVDPDVLLVDEVLSVGDLAFVLKSYRKVDEIRRRGIPVLLVSHNLQLIRNFCNRAIWLDGGKLMAHGTPNDVTAAYLKSVYDAADEAPAAGSNEVYRVHSDPAVAIDSVRFLGADGTATRSFQTGDPLTLEATIKATRPTGRLILYVTVWQEETGHMLVNHNNLDDGQVHPGLSDAGECTIRFEIKATPFVAGLHRVSLSLSEEQVTSVCDWHEKMYAFKVAGGSVGYGAFHAFPTWRNDA